MYHPFKRLETKWNAHTPKFLHPRTKENFVFQLILTVVVILGFEAADREQRRRQVRRAVKAHNYI